MQVCITTPGRKALACSTVADACSCHYIACQKLWGLLHCCLKVDLGKMVLLTKPCTTFQRRKTLTVVGAGFETMAGAQHSMMENASRIASRDQTSMDQVQQTAARGKAHVQGKLVCPYMHLHAAAFAICSMLAIQAQEIVTMREAKFTPVTAQEVALAVTGVLLTSESLLFTLPVMVASAGIQVVIRVSSCRFLQTADPGYCSTGRARQ